MKRSFAEKMKAMALALTVAAPMGYVLQISMGIALPLWYTLFFSILSAFLLELIAWNKFTAIGIPVGLILIAGYVWWMLDKDQKQYFVDYYWWAIGFLYNGGKCPLGFGIALTAITSFLTTLYFWLFGRKLFFFPAVFALVVGFVLFKWLQGLDSVLVPGILACGGLILLWAKSFQRKTARKTKTELPENGIALYLLPFAVLIVIISLISVPTDTARSWQNRQVYDMFERVNNYIADYTDFNRPRNSFSIATYGFMPMGNRLGGPVQLSDDDVLYVSASRRMLLRGVVYNSYAGNRWGDTTNSMPSRFTSSNQAALDDAFDLNRPKLSGSAADDIKRFIEPMTLYIRPVVNSASTLFVPYRGVTGITSDKLMAILPKFNAKGEAFSTYDVHAGYSYKVTANYLIYNVGGFDAMMESLMRQGLQDTQEHNDYIKKNYLALPDNIEKQVYDIVNAIVTGNPVLLDSVKEQQALDAKVTTKTTIIWMPPKVENDYDKALAIKEFLMKNYTYTLLPAAPPENMDFVSYFIDHDRNGYCTYFASAMAVMARIAGIPSRYVEGYSMPSKQPDDPAYVIKGNNAHAWAELYFEGIGWIPFDATPSGEAATETGDNSGNIMPMPTPTHPAFDTGGDSNAGAAPQKALTWADIARFLWVLPAGAAALLLLWVLAMIVRAKVKTGLKHVLKKYADTGRCCAFYYFESLKLLEYYNYPVKKGETPYAYAARIDRWLRLGTGSFLKVAELISRLSYSNYAPTENDLAFMAEFRRELAQYTYQTVGARYYLIHQVLGFKQRATRRRDN